MTATPGLPDLEPLLERIRKDALEEAERIEAEAEAQAERLLAEARSEAEAEAEEIKAQASRRARRREEAELAEARRRGRFQILSVKRDLMDEVFRSAEARIRGDSEESSLRLLEELLLRFAQPGSLTLIVDPDGRSLLEETVLAGLNEKLGRCRKGASLDGVEERVGLGGGVVLREGRREFDASLATLLGQLRESSEAALSEELFPEAHELRAFEVQTRAAPG